MEPVKFEEHIKSQLQKREIKPSADSWEKLRERLEHKEKPGGPKIWWLGIAAAIAGIFFVLGTLFNDPIDENPGVVEKPSEEIAPQEKVDPSLDIPKEEVLVAAEKVEKQPEPKIEKAPQKAIPEKNETAVVTRENLNSETVPSAPEEEALPGPSENAVAQVAASPSEVSDAEIEALLMAATKEINEDPEYAVETVNANELLEEVEYELDQSFRQKVFEVLKEGFSKAKTAVANRNY